MPFYRYGIDRMVRWMSTDIRRYWEERFIQRYILVFLPSTSIPFIGTVVACHHGVDRIRYLDKYGHMKEYRD